jgi:hypothetical protein
MRSGSVNGDCSMTPSMTLNIAAFRAGAERDHQQRLPP